MKRFISFLIFFFSTFVFSQTFDFWKGDFIKSSESSDFRVYINGTIYELKDTTWTKDIDLAPDDYKSIVLDKKINIWLFKSASIKFLDREQNKWITVPPPPTNILYGKIYGDYIYCGNGNRLYRGKYFDSSISWELVYEGGTILDFTIDQSFIYIALYSFNVIRSPLNALNWSSILITNFSPAKVAVFNNVICVGTFWEGVYTSLDRGNTWLHTRNLPDSGHIGVNRGAEEIVIKNEQEIFALTSDQISTLGWYYSSDSGKSFSSIDSGFSPWLLNQSREEITLDDQNIYLNVGYGGFYKSSDLGTTWQEINHGYNNNKPHHIKKIVETKNGEILALSSTGGNPVPWNLSSWGIFKSDDNGVSWNEISNDLILEYMILEDMVVNNDGDILVAPYEPGALFVLRNGSTNWIKYKVKLEYTDTDSGIVHTRDLGSTISSLINGDNNLIFGTTYWDAIIKSTNGGNTWSNLKDTVFFNSRGVSYVSTSGEDIYIIVKDQMGYGGPYYSSDSGENWQPINDNGIIFRGIKGYNNNLVAYTNSKIYKSIDLGSTWEEISSTNLPYGLIVNTIELAQSNTSSPQKSNNSDGTLFLASNKGAFKNTLGQGSEWEMISSNDMNCIYYSDISHQISFGGINSFINLYYGNPTNINVKQTIPNNFTLSQNYPNPFNPSTDIIYSLPNKSFVNLNIYNILGQKVRSLINAEKDTGTYKITWDGLNDGGKKLSSGVYIYMLRAGNKTIANKMVMLK